MATQKFIYGDSIDMTVKLLNKIIKKKGEKDPSLELPFDYFSDVNRRRLTKTRGKWHDEIVAERENLKNSIGKLDDLLKAGRIERDIEKISNLRETIARKQIKIRQMVFLMQQLEESISAKESDIIGVSGYIEPVQIRLKADDSITVPVQLLLDQEVKGKRSASELPDGYFSDLDQKELKRIRKIWQSERDAEHEKLLPIGMLPPAIKKGETVQKEESFKSQFKKVQKRVLLMDSLLDRLNEEIGADPPTKEDPILEEIKMKMRVPLKKEMPVAREFKEKPEVFKPRPPPTTQIMFDVKQKDAIETMFRDSSGHSGLEIEASFGVYQDDGKFSPGVYSGIYFSNLLSRLFAVKSSENLSKMDVKYSNSRVESIEIQSHEKYDQRINVRRIIYLDDDKEVWQYKNRYNRENITNRMWGIRISKSKEVCLKKEGKGGGRDKFPTYLADVKIDPAFWDPSISRYRRRTSFTETSNSGFFYGVQIDVTVVRTVKHKQNRESSGFEVEVEKIYPITVDRFTDIIERIYRWMYGDYSFKEIVKTRVRGALTTQASPSWNKKAGLISDETFAYTMDYRPYGKISPVGIRALTGQEREVLDKSDKEYRTIKEDNIERVRGLVDKKRSSKLGGKRWDENLEIITDGIYAYNNDNKIYAIIVGPLPLTEEDKDEFRKSARKFKNLNTQESVNIMTNFIRNKKKGDKDEDSDDEDSDEKDQQVFKRPSGFIPTTYKEVEVEVIWDPNHIMTLEERWTTVRLHNELFWRDMQKKNMYSDGEMKGKQVRRLWPYQLWSDYWNRPKNIKLKNFLDPKSRWALTLKYDGMRSFLFISEYGTYMIHPPYTVIYMGEGNKDMSGTLLDGEFMSELDKTKNEYSRITYWAFDILFHKKEDCREKRLIERLTILGKSVKILQENYENFPYLKRKKYIMGDSPFLEEHLLQKKDTTIYEKIVDLLKENETLTEKVEILLKEKMPKEKIERLLKKIETLLKENKMPKEKIATLLENKLSREKIESLLSENISVEKTDGLIFQPYIWYCNKYTFKWKPPPQLTIDFYLQPMTRKEIDERGIEYEEGGHYYYTMVGNTDRNRKKDMKIFTGNNKYPYDGYIIRESNTIEEGGEPIDGRIVECKWEKGEFEYGEDQWDFNPFRIREDRTRPNDFWPTAVSVWEDIKYPITRDTIEGRNLKLMRKYHNEVKMDMLSKNFAPGQTIMDIGSGRGGDISKWSKLGLKRVYAVEPDEETEESLEEFNKRLEQDKETVQRENTKNGLPFTYPIVEVLNYGAEKTGRIKRKIKEDKTFLDGIVAFFSLTFFPKNEKMYRGLLNTLDLLPAGGKFVGIVLSGDEVKTLLDKQSMFMVEYSDKKFLLKGLPEIGPDNDELENMDGKWKKSVQGWLFKKKQREDVEIYIETHKVYDSEAFTIKQEGPFFDQGDEEKKEVKGISNHEIGDEIVIDLRGSGDDQTTMVQSQTEWLFNFKYFKQKMRERGFSLVGGKAEPLNFTVPASKSDSVSAYAYSNLPKDSQVFSSLNTAFVFKKQGMTKEEIGAAEVLNPLDLDEKSPIRLSLKGVEYDNIQRIGVIQSNTSFIHAVLLAVDKMYKRSVDDRTKIIDEIGSAKKKAKEQALREQLEGVELRLEERIVRIRNRLSKNLSRAKFQELHGGSVSMAIEENIQKDIDEKRLILKKDSPIEEALRERLERRAKKNRESRRKLREKLKRRAQKNEASRKDSRKKLEKDIEDATKEHVKELLKDKEKLLEEEDQEDKDYREKLREISEEEAKEGEKLRKKLGEIEGAGLKGTELKRIIEKEAFEDFKHTLRDTGEGAGTWLGEIEMTELLSEKYGVNIYVVSTKGTLGEIVFVEPSTQFSEYCDTSLFTHDRSIVLLRQRGMDYDLLEPLDNDENAITFESNGKFVQQLYQEICG
uniref:mRNA capping enzyme n=1 Tax=Marseillevirus LCMAC101 TaxID=2506602 RepID=A0A481YSR7_9VIRU|nr:MAG: mRNA capping enzyme [Marseillevirus LCMAC101]